ncbi:MAG TPA: CBS domain-containing protein [Myxococcales bacterium]|nr:CBS domain-containing protein [Myxococcales bacterium]
MRLDEFMSSPAVTVPSFTSAADAKAAMERAAIRHLVVLGPGRQIAGVVSAGDLRDDPRGNVAEVMSSPAVTASPDTDVATAARLLRERAIGCLPVVDGGRVVGLVTVSDLLALLGKGALRVQARNPAWTLPGRGPTHHPDRRGR